MEETKNLLNRVGELSKKSEETAAPEFNIFEICGMEHYESKHSSIISEFLNPAGSHGFKSKLLECFIETLGTNIKFKNFDCEKALVEHLTNKKRTHIVIKDKSHILIIDNGISAPVCPKHLKRYSSKYAKQYGKDNCFILCLSLDGADVSKPSGKIECVPISYKETIINWLDKCVVLTKNQSVIRETITQYANYFRRLTHQSMEVKKEEKIVDMIVGNPRFIQSAEYITQIWEKCEAKILSELKNSIGKTAHDLSLRPEIGPNFGKEGSFFAFSKHGWKECIYYEFCNQGNGLLVGVNNDNNFWGRNAEKIKEYFKDFGHYEDGWVIVRNFDEWAGIKNFDERKTSAAIRAVTEDLVKKLDSFNFPSIPKSIDKPDEKQVIPESSAKKMDILTYPNVRKEPAEETEILNTSAVG
ncbi:hypothetical protein AGMMS4957_10080 [Bacteroidia bacterium]|nr:hypothetical protein AGMMS4957_10080 [Bacteroidia bacterium]